MAILGWLLNLGMAGSEAAVVESLILVSNDVTMADGLDDAVVMPLHPSGDVTMPDAVADEVVM